MPFFIQSMKMTRIISAQITDLVFAFEAAVSNGFICGGREMPSKKQTYF